MFVMHYMIYAWILSRDVIFSLQTHLKLNFEEALGDYYRKIKFTTFSSLGF